MMRPRGLDELHDFVVANDPNEEEINSLLQKLSDFDIVDAPQIQETLKQIEITEVHGLKAINVMTNLPRYALINDTFQLIGSDILSSNRSSIIRERFQLLLQRVSRN
jgi:hypothetical protein